ncbi:MAG: YkuS family protein [Syntrophomonadaceae bacterium]
MNTIVALDDGLTPVKNYLTQQGCQIVDIGQARNQYVDAIVLSGMEKDFLGIEDISVKAPVLSAQGLTPEEVWKDIQQIMRLKQ